MSDSIDARMALERAQWERAKGELRAFVAMKSGHKNHLLNAYSEEVNRAVEEFIARLEGRVSDV